MGTSRQISEFNFSIAQGLLAYLVLQDTLLPHLASFSSLTVLKATALFESDRYHLYKYPKYDFVGNVARVSKLAEACPLLERIVFEDQQIVLIRGGDELKWVFRNLGDNVAFAREDENVRCAM